MFTHSRGENQLDTSVSLTEAWGLIFEVLYRFSLTVSYSGETQVFIDQSGDCVIWVSLPVASWRWLYLEKEVIYQPLQDHWSKIKNFCRQNILYVIFATCNYLPGLKSIFNVVCDMFWASCHTRALLLCVDFNLKTNLLRWITRSV